MNHEKLRESLERAGFKNIVTLGDWAERISSLLKVHVRDCTEKNYDEISLSDIGTDGIIQIRKLNPDEIKSANASALERQRLHRGDLIFGHRGKIGKIGLVSIEHDKPLIGNHGMMRISFNEDRTIETSKYVLKYLQSRYISSYIDMVKANNTITAKLIKSLPIPYFEEFEGMSTFSTMTDKRKAIEEEAEALLKICIKRKEEVLLLGNMSQEQISQENIVDNKLLNEIKSLRTILDIEVPKTENIFLHNYKPSEEH